MPYDKLAGETPGERSSAVRDRVIRARERQRDRLAGTRLTSNAEMGAGEVRRFCKLGPDAEPLMRAAMQRLGLSARSFHRVLKLSRTIADLDGADEMASVHVAEALQYRPRSVE